MNEPRNYVTFGVQAGDVEAGNAVKPYFMKLRKLLADHCSGGYGETVDALELGFVLRIDGSIWHWEKYGCNNLRVKKTGEATIDIFMPVEVWKKGGLNIQQFLSSEVRKGFALMTDRLVKKGIAFDKEKLTAYFELAMTNFDD
jgi:hypothetical protein